MPLELLVRIVWQTSAIRSVVITVSRLACRSYVMYHCHDNLLSCSGLVCYAVQFAEDSVGLTLTHSRITRDWYAAWQSLSDDLLSETPRGIQSAMLSVVYRIVSYTAQFPVLLTGTLSGTLSWVLRVSCSISLWARQFCSLSCRLECRSRISGTLLILWLTGDKISPDFL